MALNITKGIVFKAQKVVIYGPEGIGKSSFAANFPNPVFIDTEGSTNLLDVARLPRPTSWTMMMQMINEIKKTPDCCKTLIIDTIDWAEQMCVAHVCSTYNKKSVEEFGYGKGYVYVKEEFGRFLNLLQDVIDVGINIVLTAHAQLRKFEQPNEAGSYDRYELKLGSKSGSQTSPLVKEWADIVLFANYKTFVVTVDNKKKAQGGERIMYTSHHPCWDAKNRHDLKPELPFDYTQIAYCIPNNDDNLSGEKPVKDILISATSSQPPIKESLIAESDLYFYHPESDSYWMIKKGEKLPVGVDAELSDNIPKEEYDKGLVRKKEERFRESSQAGATQTNNNAGNNGSATTIKTDDRTNKTTTPPTPVETEVKKSPPPAQLPVDIPKALADLMTANNVTIAEIQNTVAKKGYYPQDTPITKYDPGFIDGVLVGAWPQVFMAIQLEREIPF